jgi:hypothetical protein
MQIHSVAPGFTPDGLTFFPIATNGCAMQKQKGLPRCLPKKAFCE